MAGGGERAEPREGGVAWAWGAPWPKAEPTRRRTQPAGGWAAADPPPPVSPTRGIPVAGRVGRCAAGERYRGGECLRERSAAGPRRSGGHGVGSGGEATPTL
eukprot:scaffold6805_cov59-Isochrysis_galbana.AAC.2